MEEFHLRERAIHASKYYSEDRFPAWFRFSSIEEISDGEFEAIFGPPPIGDGTFFPVWRGHSVQCAPVVELIRTNRSSILHLSDIHFGHDFGFPTAAGPGKTPLLLKNDRARPARRSSWPNCRIGRYHKSRRCKCASRSGLKFLNSLSQALKVPKECFVIVPGNHDIALQAFTPSDYSHEASFNLFTKEFYGRAMKCPELRRFLLANGRTMELLAINSVRLRQTNEKQFGYVQWRLYDEALRLTERNPEDLRSRSYIITSFLPRGRKALTQNTPRPE